MASAPAGGRGRLCWSGGDIGPRTGRDFEVAPPAAALALRQEQHPCDAATPASCTREEALVE